MTLSVLRRYTPPTCTLEILAKQSPLSRWAGQTVLKNLRFQLNLDDPKQPKENWIVVTGDRLQLEELSEAVQTYVQAFLHRVQVDLDGPQTPQSVGTLTERQTTSDRQVLTLPTVRAIGLEPSGLLRHRLNLGHLAPSPEQSTITLSTLQLFDLADALDQYTADVLALPSLPQRGILKAMPNWGQVAAMAVLAVGVTTSLLRMTDASLQNREVAPVSSQGASSQDQRIANQLPPSAVQNASPLAPVTAVPTLPPPPPLGSQLPQPLPAPQKSPNQANTKLTPEQQKKQTIANLRKVPVQGAAPNTVSIDQLPAPSVLGQGSVASRPVAPLKPNAASRQTGIASAPPEGLPEASLKAPAQREPSRASDFQAAASASAFDVIPQIAEAREYFASRWKPPEKLTQALEYTIQVDAEGKVERIIPLTEASGQFIDYTEIPPAGEDLVSPLKKGKAARIRLLLGADGKVQTLLEGVDQ